MIGKAEEERAGMRRRREKKGFVMIISTGMYLMHIKKLLYTDKDILNILDN
jgi:hypothetical protein